MVRRFVHSVSDKVVGTGLIKEFGMIRSSSNDANLIGSNVKPAAIAKQGLEEAKNNNIDVVIVDSAGRLQIDKTMMDELREVKQSIKPNEFLLVVDAMTGQEAAALVNTFNVEIEISSAILTKLDGDSRGGVAFSVREVLGKHINLVGHGERIEDLEPFYREFEIV